MTSPSADFGNTHIVIPTYNERENIGRLIEELVRIYQREDLHIWVIDDSSPDDTAGLAREIGEKYRNIRVVVRTANRGYGKAVAEGMRRALADGARWVITMDADLSHSPATIGKMMDAAREGDLVIGSRYADGGPAAVKDWALWRLGLSRIANWYFRMLLGVNARDNTSGFRCWRKELLAKVLATDLQANGYAFLTESLFYAARAGARIVEVPNVYQGRTCGESKLSANIMAESLWTAVRLRVGRSL